jgi:hypothetical protein
MSRALVAAAARPDVIARRAASRADPARRARWISNLRAAIALRGPTPPIKWRTYEDRHGFIHKMRSMWEVNFATLLDRMALEWKYEPKRIAHMDGTYTPDFLVTTPFGKCYVELHRVESVMPGDEDKVDLLKFLERNSCGGIPLVLLGETFAASLPRLIRASSNEDREETAEKNGE